MRLFLDDPNLPLVFFSAPDEPDLLAAGVARDFRDSGPTAVDPLLSHIEEIWGSVSYDGPAAARPRIFGGTAFDPGTPAREPWSSFPRRWFFLPKTQLISNSEETWLTQISPESADSFSNGTDNPSASSSFTLPKITQSHPIPTKREWEDAVYGLRSQIAEGTYEKVVFAHSKRLQLEDEPVPSALIRALRERNPSCYVGAVRPTPGDIFVFATPELLVERSESVVKTDALAGTMARGSTDDADTELRTELTNSEKNQREHAHVVDAIVDGLETLGGVVSVGDRGIRRLRSVQHLHTPISARYESPPHLLRLTETLHPTPAVGGLPRDSSLEAIQASETFDRGWYAGPIGWFDRSGNGRAVIGIRSGLFRDRTARLFAGAGIVSDSDPTTEWEELQLKYRPFEGLLNGSQGGT